MTKVLLLADLAGTGFGTVTQDLGRAMLANGHDLRFVSQNELGDLPEPFASRTFRVNDPNGWQVLQAAGITGLMDGTIWPDHWTPEAAIILGDYFAVREVVMANELSRAAFRLVPTLHYIPVEGVDLPPTWRELWDIVVPVAMSEFGADQIARIGVPRPPVVYHGVDVAQFRPVSPEKPLRIGDKALRSKADCKRFFGGDPRQRWLLRTDRHMPRKRYATMLRGVAPVMASRPDLYMVMHCRSFDQGGNLPDTIAKYPKALRDRMLITGFHDQAGGASRDVLTALYNAADVYVSTSAEGFGLTIAESIACGTPAVGLDYSAVPEVIGPAGLLVPWAYLYDNEYDHLWASVDERKLGEAVATLVDDELLRKRLGREGPPHVRANFQWDKAALAFAGIIADRLRAAA